MQFLLTFLEGIISFLSPCMLPMLPLYLTYFAPMGTAKRMLLWRVLAFVLGFTAVFTALGLFAGTLGVMLMRYQRVVNAACGVVVMLLGLSYLEILPLPFSKGMQTARRADSVLAAFVFGAIYSLSLTPCVGAFLGSALMLASTAGSAAKGALLLLSYSLGLGIPFLLSAVLLQKLRTAFTWIKAHYRILNTVCGIFLILMGLLMALGWMSTILRLVS